MPGPGDLAVAHVRALAPYEPGKPLSDLQRELGITDVIKLASNENPLGPSPLALTAMRAALQESWLYPDGSGHDLKAALAANLGIPVECLTLGNGSNDLLVLLAEAFLTPQSNAVCAQFGFAIYGLVTQAVGAQVRAVPAFAADVSGAPERQPLGHDLEAMAQAVDANTRLVFIANPNNPTGTWLPVDALHRFIAAVPASTLVVLDEAYFEYAQALGGQDGLRWLTAQPNLVVLRTFSKAYGLAGMRVGYAVSHPGVADMLNRVRQPFNVGSVAMAGALAALQDADHVARGVALAHAGRAFYQREFAALGLASLPSAANFVTVAVPGDATAIYHGLLRRGVIVRPLTGYGMPRHLRISTGTEQQSQRLVTALQGLLRP